MATFLELLDNGVCMGSCLMATPDTRCDCHCGGWFHASLVHWLNRQAAGWVEYPGFADIELIKKGRRIRAVDPQHPAGGIWGARAS